MLDIVLDDESHSYDVVYSNAALHWVHNHNVLFRHIMMNVVRKNGIFAVQMPDTRVQLSHTLMMDACKVFYIIQFNIMHYSYNELLTKY